MPSWQSVIARTPIDHQRNAVRTIKVDFVLIVFLDTEFTDLVIEPRLLSVGLVEGGMRHGEFYAEVTDRDRIHAASWFALDCVLPQFGKVANAACTYAELGARLALYLDGLIALAEPADSIELAFSFHLDWEFVDLAIRDAGIAHWEVTKRRLRPVNVYQIAGFDAGKLAADAYFNTQVTVGLSRHHALFDARALRVAYEAATDGHTGERRILLPK
jgi:hypothetical protein